MKREKCPECSEILTIPESYFGRRFYCPHCRVTITAPPAELPDSLSELIPPPLDLPDAAPDPLPTVRSERRRRKIKRMREFGLLLVLGGMSFAIVSKVVFYLFEDYLSGAVPGLAEGCIGLGGAVSMGGLVFYTWCRAEAWRMSEEE